MLDPVIHKMITYVQNLEEKDLKDKVGFFSFHPLPGFCACRYLNWVVNVNWDFSRGDAYCLIVPASSQYSGPAVSHQAAVHEVPTGPGHRGGRSSAGHAAAHAQNPPFLYQDELPQRGQFF